MNSVRLAVVVALLIPAEGFAACAVNAGPDWCATADALLSNSSLDGARFGAALATGDFDGDGHLDLAIGVPETDLSDPIGDSSQPSGEVLVLFGDGTYPRSDFFRTIDGGALDAELSTPPRFGFSLAAQDFTRDGIDDLVVGAPGQDLPPSLFCASTEFGCRDAGRVHLIAGSDSRNLNRDDDAVETKDRCGLQPGDDSLFGASLAVGPGDRLYIGAPGQGLNLDEDAGYLARITLPFTGSATCELYHPLLAGEVNRRARMGASVAAVQFRNATSSTAEVAFGAPEADNGSQNQVGFVAMHFNNGAADGVYSQQVHWPPAGNAEQDHFGAALTAGDFDGDGDDDFVFAAPDKTSSAGRLYVLSNERNGIGQPIPTSIFEQVTLAGQSNEAGDQFGFALASGHINADRFEDLVVGVPGEECCADDGDEGFVAVMFGSAGGLTAAGYQQFRQVDIGGTTTVGARFGSVLATGDFNHDGLDEIVVGAPDHPVGGDSGAGKVFIARLAMGAGGQNLRLQMNSSAHIDATPEPRVDRDFADNYTVTLLGGPVEHVDRPRVVLEYEAGVNVLFPNASAESWACSRLNLSTNQTPRTTECIYNGRLLLGQSAPPLSIQWVFFANSALNSLTRTVELSSATNDSNLSNNSTTATTLFEQSPFIFSDGFE